MNGRPVLHLKRDLQLVAWNGNQSRVPVCPRYAELVEFAARYKPDVLLFGETHIDPSNGFGLPNYVFYRNDRLGRAQGGTAIAMRANLRHHRVEFLQRRNLECTAVELHEVLGGMLVVSAY